MAEEPILERVMERLMEKHISGTTMSSALDKAKEANKNSMIASINFLSADVTDRSKARYVMTTYAEMIRRISRFGINASIQVPLDQIGMKVGRDVAYGNLSELLKIGNRHGVFVWAEVRDSSESLDEFDDARGFGVAFHDDKAERYLREYRGLRAFKIIFREKEYRGKDYYERIAKSVTKGRRSHMTPVLSSLPEKAFWQLLRSTSSERNLIFEFRLGYSNSSIKKALKKGAKLCVFVPFGKDWARYAMNNVPEGYMRFLAGRLLNENKPGA
ncbi:MAG: hypothetical protein KGH50_01935 [Candidatus Micrarchaeota archaeon]|nr:hypothetical protein [Candidatus Micrarchaeota archaeon]